MTNILLDKFKTFEQTAPFSQIKLDHYKPAFEQTIQEAKQEIKLILENTEKPNFQNTIEALENSGEQLERISSIFFNLNSANTSEDLQKLAQEISPMLTAYGQSISLNEELFEKIKFVFENENQDNLSAEQKKLLSETYKSFERNGANLNAENKAILKEVSMELSKCSLTFGENVLAETNAFELHINDQNELKGLTESALEAAKITAKEKGKDGFIFTLQYPSYIPFMQFCANRSLREKMYKAFGSKGLQNNSNNNEKVIQKIVELRTKKAQILGFDTFADFVLSNRMASNSDKVYGFLGDLLEKAKPFAFKELEQLKALALEDGITEIQSWDHSYYSEKLKLKVLQFDEEKIKPYFPLNNCIDGVFQVSKKLFGLNFIENTNIDKYHSEVKTYEVTDDNGILIAILYADFHPRESKRNGAWMTVYRSAEKVNDQRIIPHISIVCNFTKPTDTKPSLLTFNELTTLFHEFGHALHGMLANTQYKSLAGTNVYWDFVELPSQVLENWCYEAETLKLFAKHYQTGEDLPLEFIDKIKSLKSFMEGYQTMRQVSLGLLDLDWHTKGKGSEDIQEFESNSMANTKLYPSVKQCAISTSFSHIFQGGYAAAYYSYKWAEILDADAFYYFKENGIFNPIIAEKFKKNILEKGGTVHPMELYKAFRGQEPKADYLLKRAGLIK